MRNILFIILVLVISNVDAQNIRRVIKQMDKKDYNNAIEHAKKILTKNPEHATANFCLAWCYYYQKDYLDAYKYIELYKSNESNIDEGNKEYLMEYMQAVMKRTRKKPFDYRVDYIYKMFKEAAINYVREKRDPEIANEYIKMFPHSTYLKNTIHIRNHYAYEKACEANTIESFNSFISKYPDAAQIDMARENIHELEYEKAKKIGTVEAVNKFIAKYPKSKQYTKAVMLRNELAFNNAKSKNTLDAIGGFIKKYPNSLQLAEAHKIRQQLVFEKAKRINTIDAYSDFVKEYPFGKYYVDIFNLKSKALATRIVSSSGIENVKFSRAYDYNKTIDEFSCATLDSDGNVYIAGTVDLKDEGHKDVWILKIDKQGKMIWNKRFGTANNDELINIYVQDTSIVSIGNYAATDSTPGKAWVLNISTKGNKNWMKIFDSFHPKTSVMINKRIYIGGYVDSDSVQNMALYKIDQQADMVWSRIYVTHGEINSIVNDDNNLTFCGANWICSIDTSGYLLNDNFIDSSFNLLSVKKQNQTIEAVGVNLENKLIVYNSENSEVDSTSLSLKNIKFNKLGEIFGTDESDNLIKLGNDLSQPKVISKSVGNYQIEGNLMFFSAKKTILSGDIVYLKF